MSMNERNMIYRAACNYLNTLFTLPTLYFSVAFFFRKKNLRQSLALNYKKRRALNDCVKGKLL